MSKAPTTFSTINIDQLEHVTGGIGIGDILGMFGPKVAKFAPLAESAFGLFGNLGSLFGKGSKTKAPQTAATQQPAPAAETAEQG
jgi:hypothetical protein